MSLDVNEIGTECTWCDADTPATWIVLYACGREHVMAYGFCGEHKIDAMDQQVVCAYCWNNNHVLTNMAEVMVSSMHSTVLEWRQWDDNPVWT